MFANVKETPRAEGRPEAAKILRARLADADRGLPVTPNVQRVKFSDLGELVINDYKRNNKKTIKDVRMRLDRHILPFFGDNKAVSITESDINKFIAKRQREEATNGEINRELTVIKRAFNLGIKERQIFFKPSIEMLAEDNIRKGFFEEPELRTLYKFLPEEVRPMIVFAYITGWRIRSEIQSLEWQNIDLRAGIIRLDPGVAKNKEGRLFPFTSELRSILEEQRKKTVALQKELGKIIPWVFHRNGKRIGYFRRSWVTACRKSGLAGRILHDFRRTAVRKLVRAGVPQVVAKQLTGHKTDSVFERYNIVSEGDLKEAAAKLEKSFGNSFGNIDRFGGNR